MFGALVGTGIGDSLEAPLEGGYDIKPDGIEATLNTILTPQSLTAYH